MTLKNKTSLVDAMSRTKDKNTSDINKELNSQIKKIIITVSPEAHYQFKRLAVEERSQIQTLAKEALNDLFLKYKLPPIA